MTDPLERIDRLPPPRAAAVAATYKVYADELTATGKVTMAEVEAAGAFGRKTILKHIRAGILPAEKARINGKDMWLFEPQAVESYLSRAADLLEEAVHRKKNRPRRVVAPDGYLSIMAAAEQCAVSHWTLREHLSRTGVHPVQGRHAAKMILEADLPRLQRYFEHFARPQSRRKEPVAAPRRGRQAGGPYFDTFDLVWSVMRAQPEFDAALLSAVAGADIKAARRWMDGSRIPGETYRGALLALFRDRFGCRLSPDLEKIALAHRREYMRRTMVRRRAEEKSS